MNNEEHGGLFGLGESNVNFAKYFIGNSYLNPLTDMNKTSLFVCNVTFELWCRNNWHIHHASKGGGQVLICVEGNGIYQQEGQEPIYLKPGDIVSHEKYGMGVVINIEGPIATISFSKDGVKKILKNHKSITKIEKEYE